MSSSVAVRRTRRAVVKMTLALVWDESLMIRIYANADRRAKPARTHKMRRGHVYSPEADIERQAFDVRFAPISEVGPRKRPLSFRQRPNCGHRRRSGSYAPTSGPSRPLASSVRTG